MLRRIFTAILILLLSCTAIANSAVNSESEEYDLAGTWHMEGGGFVKKSFVKSSLELTGSMILVTEKLRDISDDIDQIIIDETAVNIEDVDEYFLDSDMKALTEYYINLELTATELEIRAWRDSFPNGIKIPVLIPDKMPAGDYNLTLPPITYDKLTYQVTFNSASSGTVIISGYLDIGIVGECEIYSETSIWKDGSTKTGNPGGAKGGCNSGFGLVIIMLLIFFRSDKKCLELT